MREKMAIVSPAEVTPTWLTQALQQRGIDARVSRLDSENVGTGQLGETRRFFLHYHGTVPPDAPATLVGKFASPNEVARKSGREMGFYKAEVMFYRELAHRAGIRTPAVYVAELDPVSNDFTLLLEDLAPAQQGDQMRGCTLVEARTALSEAARLHASFWNDTQLSQQDWCYVPTGAQGYYTTELIEQSWDHVQKNYQGWLTPEVMAVCAKYVRNHAWWNRPREFPKCFSHNDFRPDNMMFSTTGERVAVVDWQTCGFLGTGMDLAYFLGGALSREVRVQHEDALLRDYHTELLARGVAHYTFEHLMNDYRHYSFAAIAVALAATLIVKRTDRGDAMLMHMTSGAALQALDTHAVDFLPE